MEPFSLWHTLTGGVAFGSSKATQAHILLLTVRRHPKTLPVFSAHQHGGLASKPVALGWGKRYSTQPRNSQTYILSAYRLIAKHPHCPEITSPFGFYQVFFNRFD